MKKLTKGFEASTARVNITIDGQVYEAANLRKNAIINQNIILVGQEDKWVEVDCIKLGISNDIILFRDQINSGDIMLQHLGIFNSENESGKDYRLKHEDFERLESEFPAYPYYMISLLYRHISRHKPSFYGELKQCMRRVQESGKSIPDWLRDSDNASEMFVNGVKQGKPYEDTITDSAGNSFTIWLEETNIGYKYGSLMVLGKDKISDFGSGFIAAKRAKGECLFNAVANLKQKIINSDNPENYFELLKRVQNKSKIINMTESTKQREEQLTALGLMYLPSEDSFVGHGFAITGNSIENDSDEDWQNTLDRIGLSAETATQYTPPPPVVESTPEEAPAAPQHGGSTEARVAELIAAGLKFDGNRTFELTAGTAYMAVDILDAQTYSDRKWTGLMIDIGKMLKGEPTEAPAEKTTAPPAPEKPEVSAPPVIAAQQVTETPAKKPVSLATIGGISTDRIVELQELEKSQLDVLEKHKFVKPVDAKTLKQAKANVTALRKASTGTEKIEKDASKFLNTLKTAIKNVVDKAAKLTRDALEKQEQAVKEFEYAEELRLAAIQKAKLEKIKARSERLFAVPMVFNGTAYNIGTLYILGSQIEELTDEEFELQVSQAVAIKATLDAEALANKAKEDELEAAKKRIAELTGQPYTAPGEVAQIPEAPKTVEAAAAMIDNVMPPEPAPVAPPPVAKTASPVGVPMVYQYQTEFKEAVPGNGILHKLDMENLAALENKNYLKARAYFIRGTKDVAQAIQDILNAPTQEGVKKSEQIADLCSIILNQ